PLIPVYVNGPHGEVTCMVRPMARRSNTLLVQNGIILECIRRVGPEENRYRVSLPAHEYMPPPPQTGKLDPTRLTLEDVYGIFEQNEDPKQQVQRLLSSRLLGVSPLLAKEIVFRASGQANLKAQDVHEEALLSALELVIAPLAN